MTIASRRWVLIDITTWESYVRLDGHLRGASECQKVENGRETSNERASCTKPTLRKSSAKGEGSSSFAADSAFFRKVSTMASAEEL